MPTSLHLAQYRGTLAENPAAMLFDRLICWRTKSRWSHSELVFDHAPVGASLCWSSSILDKGVRPKMIDLHSGRWDVYPLHCSSAEIDRALEWFQAHVGKPYDYLGAAGFALPLPVHFGFAWYCSEAVAAALGIQDREWMSPQRLAELLTIT